MERWGEFPAASWIEKSLMRHLAKGQRPEIDWWVLARLPADLCHSKWIFWATVGRAILENSGPCHQANLSCSCILDSPIYFLNFDRCAYGGRTDSSMYSPEDAKPVRGPTYLASYGNCSKVFSFLWHSWKPFNDSKTPYQMPCSCSGVGTLVCKWIMLVMSFSAYSFLAYHWVVSSKSTAQLKHQW